MNKVLLSISLLATTILLAQDTETPKPSIEKGTWVINTNINYYNRESNYDTDDEYSHETKQTNFSFTPNAGYLIGNNLEIGIGLGIGISKYEQSREYSSWNNGSKNYYKRINTYIKGYKPINKKLFLSLKGELSYSNQLQKSISNSDDFETNIFKTTSNNYFIGLRPGATYFMSKKIAMEFSLGNIGYSKTISESENTKNTNNTFSLNLFGPSYSIGASYYF